MQRSRCLPLEHFSESAQALNLGLSSWWLGRTSASEEARHTPAGPAGADVAANALHTIFEGKAGHHSVTLNALHSDGTMRSTTLDMWRAQVWAPFINAEQGVQCVIDWGELTEPEV